MADLKKNEQNNKPGHSIYEQQDENEQIKNRTKWKKYVARIILIIFILFCAIQILFWSCDQCREKSILCCIRESNDKWVQYIRSLPTDEEMIEHFQKHRADFEHLAKLYREDISIGADEFTISQTMSYMKNGRIVQISNHKKNSAEPIMERVNVYAMYHDSVLWFPPDPYSDEAKQSRKEFPYKFWSEQGRRLGGVVFYYSHAPVIRFKNMEYVVKKYYFTPFPPHIKRNTIYGDLLSLPDGDWLQLYSNLNKFPSTLEKLTCVCKQIEPQWFIKMCQ